MNTKNIVLGLIALLLIAGGVYFITQQSQDAVVVVQETEEAAEAPAETNEGEDSNEDTAPEMTGDERGEETVLGTSVNGDEIVAYHFGSGETEILLIGGTHGSDAPSTAALAEEFVAYFAADDSAIADNLMVTIIPNLNPDGAEKSGAAGRFNENNVDLNRNFDCEWSETAVWRQQEVSGGSKPFSEPEAAALRDYVDTYSPNAAVVWFASEGKVYPSACATTPSNASVQLAAAYASAAGYPAEAEFDAYAITGDMVNWMAKEGVPAISVLLTDRTNTEWTKNEAGVMAVLAQYAN